MHVTPLALLYHYAVKVNMGTSLAVFYVLQVPKHVRGPVVASIVVLQVIVAPLAPRAATVLNFLWMDA